MSVAVRRRVWRVVVPHHAEGARWARQRLAAELTGLLAPSLLSDVVTVVAELLGNAVRHAEPLPGGVIRLSWWIGPAAGRDSPLNKGTAGMVDRAVACVRVRVTDGGADQLPVARSPDPDSVDGRGLAIVSALAWRWGVERAEGSQCVWAEFAIPGPDYQ